MQNRPFSSPDKFDLEPQLFLDFIQLYEKYRDQTRRQPIGVIKIYGAKLLSFIRGDEPADVKINSILSQVKSDLIKNKTFDDWYDMIFNLRELAEECREKKISSSFSLSWLSLHALADLIIEELHSYPMLQIKIDKLVADISQLKKSNQENGRNGKRVSTNNATIQKLTIRLAMLGETDYIINALNDDKIQQLFVMTPEIDEYIKVADENADEKKRYNSAIPLCLHRGLYSMLYQVKYQPREQIDIATFIEKSLRTGIASRQKRVLELEDLNKKTAKKTELYEQLSQLPPISELTHPDTDDQGNNDINSDEGEVSFVDSASMPDTHHLNNLEGHTELIASSSSGAQRTPLAAATSTLPTETQPTVDNKTADEEVIVIGRMGQITLAENYESNETSSPTLSQVPATLYHTRSRKKAEQKEQDEESQPARHKKRGI